MRRRQLLGAFVRNAARCPSGPPLASHLRRQNARQLAPALPCRVSSKLLYRFHGTVKCRFGSTWPLFQHGIGSGLSGARCTLIRALSCTNRTFKVCRDNVSALLGRVAEWQTRWLQVPVSFGTWGFKSPFAHHKTRPRTHKSWWPRFFCCRLSGRSLDEAQNEVQCGARKRVADWLRGRGGRSDLRVHHPWRQCAGWEIDDGVDVVDGVVGTVGHRERETAEVGDRSVGRCSTNCTAEGDRGSERADTEAAVVRDKRVGVSSPFTDVLPFVVTASA